MGNMQIPIRHTTAAEPSNWICLKSAFTEQNMFDTKIINWKLKDALSTMNRKSHIKGQITSMFYFYTGQLKNKN